MADKVKKALGPKGDKARRALHTEGVHYKRAHNGGYHAEVERHTGDGKHHHTEHHVIPNANDLAEHLQDHMGDQPAAGEQQPQQEAEPQPGAEMAGGGAGGPDMGGGGAGPMPPGA